MNLKNFESGSYKQQFQYQSFLPEKINHSWVWHDAKINVLLEEATRVLGELNAFSIIVPNIDLFIQMHIQKEANVSSRIEGTKTTIAEDLMNVDDIAPEKRDDWQEVQNYVKAMNFAIEQLEKIPLSNRLLKMAHAILLKGVRGEEKERGEFRCSQNWIGGSSLVDAVYIPPHPNEVSELMSDLEKFWHNIDIDVPHLIRIAISHYQFETIHPFLDGNGRIGRLLITLYLINHGLLKKPSLYLSDFFEKNRTSYYDALQRTRESNDLIHWIKFFLQAVIITAEKGKNTFQGILKLKNEIDNIIISLGRRTDNAKNLANLLYRKPILNVNEAEKYFDADKRTIRDLLNEFVKLGILEEITGFRRNRIFAFKKYIGLF